MEILTAYCKRYLLPAPQIGFVALTGLCRVAVVVLCSLLFFARALLVLFSLGLSGCDLTVTVPQLVGLCRVAVVVVSSLLSLCLFVPLFSVSCAPLCLVLLRCDLTVLAVTQGPAGRAAHLRDVEGHPTPPLPPLAHAAAGWLESARFFDCARI
jgi:hypothetical protein